MKKYLSKICDKIAKDYGYINKDALFYDYNIIPSVLTPKHTKFEFLKLVLKYIIKYRI